MSNLTEGLGSLIKQLEAPADDKPMRVLAQRSRAAATLSMMREILANQQPRPWLSETDVGMGANTLPTLADFAWGVHILCAELRQIGEAVADPLLMWSEVLSLCSHETIDTSLYDGETRQAVRLWSMYAHELVEQLLAHMQQRSPQAAVFLGLTHMASVELRLLTGSTEFLEGRR